MEYCVEVVDQSINEKKNNMEDLSLEPSSRRKIQAEAYAEDVKVRVVSFTMGLQVPMLVP